MADAPPRSVLDRPVARLAALAVFALSVAALVYIHRADIWPEPEGEIAAADDPVAHCIAERHAQIDGMVEQGVIGAEQEALFKSRAEALCRAQAEGGAPGLGDPAGGLPGGVPALPPPGALRPATPGGAPPPPGSVRPPGQ